MVSDVEKLTQQGINSALYNYVEEVKSSTEKLEKTAENTINKVKKGCNEIQDSTEQLFKFDSIKTAVFWSGQILNLVTFVILLFVLLGKL